MLVGFTSGHVVGFDAVDLGDFVHQQSFCLLYIKYFFSDWVFGVGISLRMLVCGFNQLFCGLLFF